MSPYFCMHVYPYLRASALVYRALANERRLRILEILSRESFNEKEIAKRIDISIPATSRHLRLLILAGLLRSQRQGMEVIFSINDQLNIGNVINPKKLLTKRLPE